MDSFADILAPLSVDDFLQHYYQQKYCHIKGGAKKFSAHFSWDTFNRILNQSQIWSAQSLNLVRDGISIAPSQYCYEHINRDKINTHVPDLQKVESYIASGATMICNDIDTLDPALNKLAGLFEQFFKGQIQSNLYCSSSRKKGFSAHFDTHDVFALQFIGTKTWHIYEHMVDNPVNHPFFKNKTSAEREKQCGAVQASIEMEEGDLLYIPRGLYHDALANDEYTVHIAFGVTHLLGLDIITQLHQHLTLSSAISRADLPVNSNKKTDEAYLEQLQQEITHFFKQPHIHDILAQMRDSRPLRRGHITLPIDKMRAQYQVNDGFTLNRQGAQCYLHHPRGKAITVPPHYHAPMQYIMSHKKFTRKDIQKLLKTDTAIDEFMSGLCNMGVL